MSSLSHSHIRSLVNSQSFSPNNLHVAYMSVHDIVELTNASCWPTTHSGKKVRQPSIFKIIQQHTNNWEANILLTQCTIFPYWCPLTRVWTNILSNDDVNIGNFLRCSCVYFVKMLASYLVLVECMCIVNMWSCLINDHVLWAHGRIHSSLYMELGWNLMFVESQVF
jgi:hypothetical protein